MGAGFRVVGTGKGSPRFGDQRSEGRLWPALRLGLYLGEVI